MQRHQQQRNKSKMTTTRKKNKQLFLWVLLGIGMAVVWMGRGAEAAFAPGSRTELVPSSGEGGLLGSLLGMRASLSARVYSG